MTQDKPRCSDFIVSATRALRRNPINTNPNASAGVQIAKVFNFSREKYSPREFVHGLQTLIRDGEAVVIAKVVSVDKTDNTIGLRYGFHGFQKIISLPPCSVLDRRSWRLDDNQRSVNPEGAKRYRLFTEIRLYIKADGLPRLAAALTNGRRNGHVTPSEVIASMRKSR